MNTPIASFDSRSWHTSVVSLLLVSLLIWSGLAAAGAASTTAEVKNLSLNGGLEDGKARLVIEAILKGMPGDQEKVVFSTAFQHSIKITRELTRLDARHRADFNEDLDDARLEAHIAAARDAGRPFRTVTDAYEDMTKQARIDKLTTAAREEGKREALKDRATANVPGVTPTGASPMLTMLHKRPNGTTDSGTHLDKAARALEERLNARGEQVA